MNQPSPSISTPDQRAGAARLAALQRQKLAAMLKEVLATNPFYRAKFAGISFDPLRGDLADLPLTTRVQIEQDQAEHPPFGANLTYPLSNYCRFHQTSGSSGRPMRWLDTAQSWQWFGQCWRTIYAAAGVGAADRLLFAFSFGPFIGFWAAFETATQLGAMCLASGGMTTAARLALIRDNAVSVVLCTPTYALRMLETAGREKFDLAGSSVRVLIVAGESGGSIPAVRKRLEDGWGARVFDHNGMTEIGSVGYECQAAPLGIHIIESEFIAEVIDPSSGQVVPEIGGFQSGELVLTNLGRWGSPLIRYRTGDLVRLSRAACACGCGFARLEGGILGRVDDMVIVRGNNVYPSAVEAVVGQFPQVAEFRVLLDRRQSMMHMRVEIEPADGPDADPAGELAQRVGEALHAALSFKAEVVPVARGSLPRFEMKSRRFVHVSSDKP